MVPGINLAAGTETADHLHAFQGGLATCTEQYVRLVFFQGVFLVILADFAIFPADCPVLFRVDDYRLIRYKHGQNGVT